MAYSTANTACEMGALPSESMKRSAMS
jgi:hypothetical protein